MPNYELRELYQNLEEDQVRNEVPFEESMNTAHKVLWHPYAREGDKIKALELWIMKHQPCVFGRLAAVDHGMHFCLISDQDLYISDQHVAGKIRKELLAWKRRSLRPAKGVSVAAHGFMLVLISEKVARARPDENLHRLVMKLRDMWGCVATESAHGTVYWESLFLQNPQDQSFVQFTFSVDFFAAQGDGRWWRDHRVPGGVAFTANSVGHMRRYREWYLAQGDQREWILKRAMSTIDGAAPTTDGPATWLEDLIDGRPRVERIACPFADIDKLPPKLRGKDWTRYGGHLHTDHSIRPELFDSRLDKSDDIKNNNWIQDFAYLYDGTTQDHVRFSAGHNVSRQEVIAEIGDPEDFTAYAGPRPANFEAVEDEPDNAPQHPDVAAALLECQKWELTQQQLIDMMI